MLFFNVIVVVVVVVIAIAVVIDVVIKVIIIVVVVVTIIINYDLATLAITINLPRSQGAHEASTFPLSADLTIVSGSGRE